MVSRFILCIVEDPIVRETKKMVLEHIGFHVTAVGTLRETEYLVSRGVFDLVLVGRSVTDANKRAVADIVRRKLPQTPLLEMCDVSPVITGADYVLHSSNPEDLAEMVKAILQPPPPRVADASS